jgi:membrane-bound ClpP family serine protease
MENATVALAAGGTVASAIQPLAMLWVVMILFIIGAVFLHFGFRNPWSLIWDIGIVCFIVALVLAITLWQEFRYSIVAIAVLGATIISLYSIEQTRLLRQDASNKENRERKQRDLSEITTWAVDILSCGSDINVEYALSARELEGSRREEAEEIKVRSDLKTLWVRYRGVIARASRIKVPGALR